jgi:hypothetical protein
MGHLLLFGSTFGSALPPSTNAFMPFSLTLLDSMPQSLGFSLVPSAQIWARAFLMRLALISGLYPMS